MNDSSIAGQGSVRHASFLMPEARPDEPLAGYPLVASICVAIGLLAVYLGGLLQPASPREAPTEVSEPASLA